MAELNGIPLDTAAGVSTVLEGILYGSSILMFIGTLWALMHRRMNSGVNRRIVTVACSLLLFSTFVRLVPRHVEFFVLKCDQHMVIDIIRTEEGLMLQQDPFPDGPVVSFLTFPSGVLSTRICCTCSRQVLVGDGVVSGNHSG
ncbi:hypothetical protein BS17DRAFT_380534 [Gyrodon lividus]|nr:hypothetical protein BS17DRAFT_380534 [Gyrodon lividus]